MRSSSVHSDTLLTRRVRYLAVRSAFIPVLVTVGTCLIVSERGRAFNEHAVTSLVEDVVEFTVEESQSELQSKEQSWA